MPASLIHLRAQSLMRLCLLLLRAPLNSEEAARRGAGPGGGSEKPVGSQGGQNTQAHCRLATARQSAVHILPRALPPNPGPLSFPDSREFAL